MMSRALNPVASDSRAGISEPCASVGASMEEHQVHDASQLSTFPTDQVPQPVWRDAIATTAKAAATDRSAKGVLLPEQSAPTVQAQDVSSTTVTGGRVNCDPTRTVPHPEHCSPAACDLETIVPERRVEAGLSVNPVTAASLSGCSSVIASSSCPLPAPAGNSNSSRSTDTLQSSVNSCYDINKGNYCLLINDDKTAVTVPNNCGQWPDGSGPVLPINNNSYKFVAIVSYDDVKLNGALTDDQSLHDIPTTDKSEPNPTSASDQTGVNFQDLIKLCKRTAQLARSGIQLPKMGLFGGGESSLSTGTTGWGTPPGTNANNNNGNNSTGWGNTNNSNSSNQQQQWNNNQNRQNANNQQPSSGQDSKQAGNSNQSANMSQQPAQTPSSQANGGNPAWGNQNSTNGNNKNAPGQPGNQPGQPTAQSNQQNQNGVGGVAAVANGQNQASTKQQLEQLNNMREALFAQDGWGGQHVNQDTNWDIPSSPEPQMKIDGAPQQWKPAVNNGTDLWEVNLRNGGQPPPQPQQKTPWGHTPSTNIGGTWGEDDDVADSSNVWTGVPNAQAQWGAGSAAAGTPGAQTGNTMWGSGPAPKKESEWGNNGGASSGWGDPRAADPRQAAVDPRDILRDPRDIRANSSDPMRMLDPREQMRIVNSDMRGDPRGITGRLNGSGTDGMWGQPPQAPHHLHHQPGKLVGGPGTANGANVNQWPGPPPKEISIGTGKPSGWEELSPPSQRRMPNYDDGTSLWGNPANQGSGGNLSHWKDLPTGPNSGMGRGTNMGCPPGMTQSRLKPDGSVWSSRNGSWEDGAAGGHTGWGDETKWPDGSGGWAKLGGKPGISTPLWDNDMDWGHKAGPKQLTKDIIWSSKQFRMLMDMGYKKEDVENALRARDMSFDAALDLLNISRNNSIDAWRTRHDEHFDHQNTEPFPGQRFGPAGPSAQMPFLPSSNPSLLNSINSSASGSSNPPLASINNMSPAIVHNMLSAAGGTKGFGNTSGGNSGSGNRSLPSQSQPSAQQLRLLVQQIQMAVQAGYLNHQILNQPLAPQTLLLLNQLLQQINRLQQLMAQQTLAQSQSSLDKRSTTVVQQCHVLITKTKQQITNLQNQIAAQQAIYVKQHQQHHLPSGGVPQSAVNQSAGTPADFFKSNIHDSINALQGNFAEIGLKDSQMSYQNQQSRLNQWKLPALEKSETEEFSRAPGSTKPLVPSHSSPNLNPLGPDGLWSNGRSSDTGGWPDATDSRPTESKEWPTNQSQPSLTDLVPEFEPGKPWKGQIKSIEDDPSITPGSVVRSPLSLATIKDTEIFTSSAAPSKPSPPGGVSVDAIQPLSLSSSTWSFNPATTTPSAFTSPLSKVASSKGTWGDSAPPPTAVTSELWGAPMAKSRGPPPGLAKGTSNISIATNGWSNAGNTRASWSSQTGNNWGSPWLLLRNLTAQIDGSTLRTLCMQHGPLQSFHLYLHQGFALVKYSTREEATKAQQALNNCVLGNTTILAEGTAESDANNLLQQLAPQQSASSGAWRQSGNKTTSDTWNTGWPTNPTSASLWGTTPIDSGDPARATPSSLNSFLPGDLLGGESM